MMPLPCTRARRCLSTLLLAGASLLASCGGSISLGFGSGFTQPAVTLTASRTTVLVGESTVLIAAATDAVGIDRVEFYRLDGGTSERLATTTQPPYQVEVILNTAGSQVFFARAVNFDGRFSDSNTVTVTALTP